MDPKEKYENLFTEFKSVSTEEWEEKINQDLKGADYEKKLVWKTIDGLKFQPYYRSEHLESLDHLNAVPGAFPFVRGAKTQNNNWEIRQDIQEEDVKRANAIAVNAVERGAEGVGFRVKKVESQQDITDLLRYIELEKTAVHFTSAKEYPFIAELFIKEMRLRTADNSKVKGSFNFDPFNYFLLKGEFYNSLEDNMEEAKFMLEKIAPELPGFKMININADVFHNAGASVVQELALALASANDYLSQLTDKGLTVDQIAKSMQITFSIGSSYFMEIAKIRAARMLWSNMISAYKPECIDELPLYVHTVTSKWNKSLYDPYVNMLRTTTEAMSGAIAGTNSMSVSPFDNTYKSEDDFSGRIARNTQIILKEESYFDKIIDPSAGSYYIENLTDSIAKAAWELFQEIEGKGGFLKAVEAGSVKEMIETTAQKRDMDIAMRKTTILGTNQFPNQSEEMIDKIEDKGQKDYPGLRLYRGAEAFEKMRMQTETYVKEGNKKPAVFLLTYGNLTMRKARATFASNFFACAGYEVIDNAGFANYEEAANAALESKAEIIVLCSADDEYLDMATALCDPIKTGNPDASIIVAGNPKDIIDELKAKKVDDFIHVRTNVLDCLQSFQTKLGLDA